MSVRASLSGLLVIVASQLVGVVGCSALKEAFNIGDQAAQANDPTVDFDIAVCRGRMRLDMDSYHDAGGAYYVYDNCMKEAGLH